MANVFTPSINNVVTPTEHATQRHDVLTVSAIAVLVYALATVLHEGVGHGGACVLVHGAPRLISSMQFDCGLPDGAHGAERIVAAGGTIATLLGGLAALALYQVSRLPGGIRYSLWLFAAVNLMQGTGYLLYSGVGNVGDWAQVIQGIEPEWLWRIVLAAVGGASYYRITLMMFAQLDPFLGEARPRRYEHGLRLAVRAYFVGAALEIIAGMLNPAGFELVLVSGIAASLGGTAGLAWGPQMLRGTRTPSSKLEKPVCMVRRNWIIIALAAIAGIAFIVVLGPTMALSTS